MCHFFYIARLFLLLFLIITIGCDYKSETNKRENQIESLPFIKESHEVAYKELAKIFLKPKISDSINVLFNDLKDYTGDKEYHTTLNFIMAWQYKERDIDFFIGLDWKTSIEDFEWIVSNTLKNNFDITFPLPKASDFNKDAHISWDNVLGTYYSVFEENGFRLGNIDTGGDEYVIFIHKLKDTEKVNRLLKILEYKYLSLKDL